ncbi:Glycosyltransferase involved in cell wall bisynthesis [Paracoccus isoporae]|uniref:Glycosyltransferase involved in cell wall bisynthesis n=1 Tax=Paracoccus isoporae TaxID=591205 RepID=A0A1G7HGY6_9RHOB|nr:glycosyltransferase family 4 protein [Paracoccus isoporae]SDE99621.1 Glycosyltransferase involved in cell wall bisynthesis [Paracoccus isoporae]
MKILYAYLYCNFGGVSSVIRERMKADTERQIHVTCCFSLDAGGSAQMQSLGADVHLQKDYIGRVCKLVNEEHFDVVHLIDDVKKVAEIRACYSGPLVLEMHTSTPAFFDEITDDVVSMLDRVLVPSHWSYQEVIARLQSSALIERVEVLPNIAMPRGEATDVESDTARLKLDGVPYLLWIGKISHGKNWLDALRIFSDLRRQIPVRFIMCTGGTLNLESSALFVSELIALGIEDAVDWRHSVGRETMSNIYSAVAESGGALLCTSQAESFGLVVVEGLAHGVPVFSSNTHALPELIQPGINGQLFPVGGTSDACQKLLQYFEGDMTFDRSEIESTVPSKCRPQQHFDRFTEIFKSLCRKGGEGLTLLEQFEGYENRTLPTAQALAVANG